MFYLMAFCIGMALAIQSPINAALGKSLSHSFLLAAFLSFSVGTLCLGVLAYFNGVFNLEILKTLLKQEWWKYLGGFLGAFVVFGTILLAPKIGLANMFLLIVIGQILTSLFLDSFGAFGLQVREISLYKIIGICLIFVGLFIFFSKDILKT